MAKSPKKSGIIQRKSGKAPGKSHIPKSSFRQRRFSIIDSDSSSLSDFEQDQEPVPVRERHQASGDFQAIASDSEDDDSEQDSDDTNEELWRNHAGNVVNTSSDGGEDSSDSADSSSEDDEDVDFVKLSAERKKKMQEMRSVSPFKDKVDFTFEFNNEDHKIKMQGEPVANGQEAEQDDDEEQDMELVEEEDVGEELPEAEYGAHGEIADSIIHPELNFDGIDSESDNDIDKDELLRTLEQDSDGIDTGLETGDDEYNLLREEADNIADEFVNPQKEQREELVVDEKQDEVQHRYYDEEYDEEEDEDDFFVPYFDDSAFKEKLYHSSKEDSEDDSYLWDYFFSSGEEEDDEEDDEGDQETGGAGHGASSSGGSKKVQFDEIDEDDEATDEDTTLPPPSTRKKVGSKARELLSSSSLIARPPALGTWATDSKPFGIIDGLSTRSLLPMKKAVPGGVSTGGAGGAGNGSVGSSVPGSSNIEELTLDELLNMSELDDDDELNHEEWLQVTGSNRKVVPLNAFRNKGVNVNEDHLNATRLYVKPKPATGVPSSSKKKKKMLKSRNRINEIILTPVKAHGSGPGSGSLMRRKKSFAEAAVEGLRVTRNGVFSEDTLNNVEELLSGISDEAELSILFREI